MGLATVLYPIGMDLGGAFSSSSQSVGGGQSSSASPEKEVLRAVVPVVCLMVSYKRMERMVGWKGWLVLGKAHPQQCPWEWCETTFCRFSLGSDVCSCSAEHRDLLAACPSCDEFQHHPHLFWQCWKCSVLQYHLSTSAELCVEFIFVWDYQATLLDGC